MHFKRKTAAILSAVMISVLSMSAISADGIVQPVSISKISIEESISQQSYFGSFTGKVKQISDSNRQNDVKYVLVESKDGQEANIVISKDSYILNNVEIKVGSTITGYFAANAPMIMIYPAQYSTEVVVVETEQQSVKVDTFDKDLVSSDNFLKLNISEKTEVVTQDGKLYKGGLADRKLVVTYDISTKSIPAQTNPLKVVVLNEKTGVNTPEANTDASRMGIVVENKKLETPAAYTNAQGVVMVPLRAISEALGYTVEWEGKTNSVMIGKGISLTIGKDYYTYMKTAPIGLGTAPEVVNERTFVPLSFFKEVMKMNNAYVFESQIVIDNEDPMK